MLIQSEEVPSGLLGSLGAFEGPRVQKSPRKAPRRGHMVVSVLLVTRTSFKKKNIDIIVSLFSIHVFSHQIPQSFFLGGEPRERPRERPHEGTIWQFPFSVSVFVFSFPKTKLRKQRSQTALWLSIDAASEKVEPLGARHEKPESKSEKKTGIYQVWFCACFLLDFWSDFNLVFGSRLSLWPR